MLTLDINRLTGHVYLRTRREMERLAALQNGGAPGHPENAGGESDLKEANVLVMRDAEGNLVADPDMLPNQERYIVVHFMAVALFDEEQTQANVGSTFDLAALWPDGLPAGVSYYLLRNQTGRDINVVLGTAPQLRPADTIVKAGGCREASLYAGEACSVLTISDDLIDVES